MSKSYLFTSESVAEGHPDKVADQISDAVLDAILAQDQARARRVRDDGQDRHGIVAGEITTNACDRDRAHRAQAVLDIGYDHSDKSASTAHTCGVLNLHRQAVAGHHQGVDRKNAGRTGRGRPGPDVRLCDERDRRAACPPRSSTRIASSSSRRRSRKNGKLPWLRPDAKSQVTLRYENDKAVAIDAVVLSTQHAPSVKQKDLQEGGDGRDHQARAADEVDPQEHQVPHQPDRQVRDRRSGGRLRPHRPQDHRRHATAAGPATAAARSRARTRRRSIARPRMRRATSRRTSSPRASRIAARCRCRTRSASRIRRRSR